MPLKRKFVFSNPAVTALEERVVLSRVGLGGAAQVGRLSPGQHRVGRAEAQINASFQGLRDDYFQAQESYLRDFNSAEGRTAFDAYVTQRVNLLSQELSRVLAAVPGGSKRVNGSPPVQTFIQNRILGTGTGSLLGGLRTATPPVGTAPTSASLFSLTATDAIDAGELASLNGIRFLKGGVFQDSDSKNK